MTNRFKSECTYAFDFQIDAWARDYYTNSPNWFNQFTLVVVNQTGGFSVLQMYSEFTLLTILNGSCFQKMKR